MSENPVYRCLLQGPHSQPDSPTRSASAGNGPYGTPPHGAHAFGTPASNASQHSFEDEETLLLDPQVPPACFLEPPSCSSLSDNPERGLVTAEEVSGTTTLDGRWINGLLHLSSRQG